MKQILILLSIFILNAQNITSQKVSDHIYMIQGPGGNIAISVGEDGVFMIDDLFDRTSEGVMNEIKKITDQHVKFLINTHFHGDHTGGNDAFAKTGAIVVAHENVRKRFFSKQFVKFFKGEMPIRDKIALPVVTFSNSINFHMNGDDIDVIHVKNAHTDGDSFIYFKQSNVLHTGDLYFSGMFPFFDNGNGATMDGLTSAIETVLSVIDDKTIIIPGHGGVSNKKEYAEYLEMIKDLTKQLRSLTKVGKSLEDIQNMNITKKYDDKFGKSFIKSKDVIFLIHENLTMKK